MKKQITSLAIGLTLNFGYGSLHAYADTNTTTSDTVSINSSSSTGTETSTSTTSVVSPVSDTYDTFRLIENSVYELAQNSSDKALLQSDYSIQRAQESDLALKNGDSQVANDLADQSATSAQLALQDLADAKSSNEDTNTVEKTISDNTKNSLQQLTQLLNKPNFPIQGKAGLTKAIAAQQRALAKVAIAHNKIKSKGSSTQQSQGDQTSSDQSGTKAQTNHTDTTSSTKPKAAQKKGLLQKSSHESSQATHLRTSNTTNSHGQTTTHQSTMTSSSHGKANTQWISTKQRISTNTINQTQAGVTQGNTVREQKHASPKTDVSTNIKATGWSDASNSHQK